jgi:ubiquinone/menaquinone biosynthesis C-methylase UbiE
MSNLLSNLYWDIYSLTYELVDNLPIHREELIQVSNILRENNPETILDVGCGTGNLISILSDYLPSTHLYGMDISQSMLKKTAKKVSSKNVKLLRWDIDCGLPFPNEFFDGISCIHVLNYLKNPSFVCNEFARTLKKNGNLVLVSFKDKLSFWKLKPYHSQLIKEYSTKDLRGTVKLLPLYFILTLCNLPIRFTTNIKYYDEKALDKFINGNLIKIESKEVFLNESVLVYYKKL